MKFPTPKVPVSPVILAEINLHSKLNLGMDRVANLHCFSDAVLGRHSCNPLAPLANGVMPGPDDTNFCAVYATCGVHLGARWGLGLAPGEDNYEKSKTYCKRLDYDELVAQIRTKQLARAAERIPEAITGPRPKAEPAKAPAPADPGKADDSVFDEKEAPTAANGKRRPGRPKKNGSAPKGDPPPPPPVAAKKAKAVATAPIQAVASIRSGRPRTQDFDPRKHLDGLEARPNWWRTLSNVQELVADHPLTKDEVLARLHAIGFRCKPGSRMGVIVEAIERGATDAEVEDALRAAKYQPNVHVLRLAIKHGTFVRVGDKLHFGGYHE